MHVALVSNPASGERKHGADELASLLRREGHDVRSFGRTRAEISRAIAGGPDVLVAAGGDGTIANAAIVLAGSTVPLFVLPLGTANNVANAFCLGDDVPALVRRLGVSSPVRFDLGQVSAPWGERPFVESAGVGLIGAIMRRSRSRRGREMARIRARGLSCAEQVDGASRGVARLIRRFRACRYEIVADGRDLSGDYVIVEAMNIPSIGPRLTLASGARSDDGQLELVLIGPDDVERVAASIEKGAAGADLPVRCERVRRVEIRWPESDGHVDDRPWPERAEGTRGDDARVKIEIRGGVTVLVPP